MRVRGAAADSERGAHATVDRCAVPRFRASRGCPDRDACAGASLWAPRPPSCNSHSGLIQDSYGRTGYVRWSRDSDASRLRAGGDNGRHHVVLAQDRRDGSRERAVRFAYILQVVQPVVGRSARGRVGESASSRRALRAPTRRARDGRGVTPAAFSVSWGRGGVSGHAMRSERPSESHPTGPDL